MPGKKIVVQKSVYETAEAYSSESVEESLVVVVGDSAAILDLTQHVADRVPRHALHTAVVSTRSFISFISSAVTFTVTRYDAG